MAAIGVLCGCGPRQADAGDQSGATGLDASTTEAIDSGSADEGGSGGAMLPDIAYESGARLRAHVLDAGGGALLFVDWWDTELSTHCSFAVASDGRIRCLPDVGANLRYLDDACTLPAALVHQVDTPLPFYVTEREPECNRDREAREVMSAVALDRLPPVYSLDGEGCVPWEPIFEAKILRLEPVDVSGFSAAEVVVDPRGDRLEAEVLVGEDGSRQLSRAIDRSLEDIFGPVCSHFPGIPGRCIPRNNAAIIPGYFSDRACTTPVALSSTPDCQPASLGWTQTECFDDVRSLFDLGAVVDTIHLLEEPDGCVPGTGDGGPWFQPVQDEIPASTFAETTMVRHGTGRLRTSFATAGGAIVESLDRPFGATWLWDEERSQPCAVRTMDGELWCVPWSTVEVDSWIAYADPDCTRGLVDPVGCEFADFVSTGGQSGAGPSLVYPVEEPHELDTVWVTTARGCEARDHLGGLWVVGASMAPGEVFPKVVDRIE